MLAITTGPGVQSAKPLVALGPVPTKLATQSVKRFATLAAILILAAQTIAAQHVHESAAEPVCVVCASTAQEDSLPPVFTPAPHPEAIQRSQTLPLAAVPAPRRANARSNHARAPPSL